MFKIISPKFRLAAALFCTASAVVCALAGDYTAAGICLFNAVMI